MAFKVITLTQNGDYIAIASPQLGGHKTDIITFGIADSSNFGGGKLLEKRAYLDVNGDLSFTYETSMNNGVSPIEIDVSSQISRAVANKNIWYIWRLDGSTGANIQIAYDGLINIDNLMNGSAFRTNISSINIIDV
jgi:hypothetical protein